MIDGVTDAQGPEQAKLVQAFAPLGLEGLGLYHFEYGGTPILSGVSDRHTIVLNRSSYVGIACSIGSTRLDHTAMAGNVTLIPAETEWTATAGGALDNIIVSIPKASFAVAAARTDRPSLSVAAQMRGHDGLLRSIMDEMTEVPPSAAGSATRWHDLTVELLDHLAGCYRTGAMDRGRGRLAPETIGRINAYLASRLEQAVAVDELAHVAAQSGSHFPRIFRRTVGMSPHQYIVRLRLRRARELLKAGLPLAEVAIRSGFSDQSHLSHWVRRIHGTTPARWGGSSS